MLTLDTVHVIDARDGLGSMPQASVDLVITSPPYWSSRDYKVLASSWADGSQVALGLEPTLDSYLDHLLEVFDAASLVLKPSGSLWVNIGDCYAGAWSTGRAHLPEGVGPAGKPVREKSLCLIPERFALRMVERGWILRNRIIWHKPNYLPASVKDRFAASVEHLFLFTKSERYHFDIDAVRVPHLSPVRAARQPHRRFRASRHPAGHQLPPCHGEPRALHPLGKNPGDCWSIPTTSGFGDHPAVFPEKLCERPILAGCPVGGVVLDPFAGSGTACAVAKRLGRRYLGFEIHPRFAESARLRLAMTDGGGVPAPATESAATREAA